MSGNRRRTKIGVTPTWLASNQPVEAAIADLASGRTFWRAVVDRYVYRELSRADLREIIRRGLSETGGSYEALSLRYNLPPEQHFRFLMFLVRHDAFVLV